MSARFCIPSAVSKLGAGCILAPSLAVLTALSPIPSPADDGLSLQVGSTPDAMVTFSRAELDALPQREIATSTPWTEGIQHFSGPTLQSVLDLSGSMPMPCT